jgi:hypothetical protein
MSEESLKFEHFVVLVLLILALLPRVLNLDAFITWDRIARQTLELYQELVSP